MSNLDEIKLNLLLNKSLLYYKSQDLIFFLKKNYFNLREENMNH